MKYKPKDKNSSDDFAGLTHFDQAGQARMVDVGAKAETARQAVAAGAIQMLPETLLRIKNGEHSKGNVLAIARVAAIQAAKRTSDLIPLCHPLPLTKVEVEFVLDEVNHQVDCQVLAECVGRTGVEMEALTAVSVALLTIYDMCKSVDRGMQIDMIRLLKKMGGKSGLWVR